jgi:hypothetical protein
MTLADPNSQFNAYVPYLKDLDELILLQESEIQSFKKWLAVFAGLGIANIGLAFLLYTRFQGLAPQVVALGSIFFGAAAMFPYREIVPRRSSIAIYTLLKRRFERFPSLSEDERKRIVDLVDEVIKKKM